MTIWSSVEAIRSKGGTPQIQVTRKMLVLPPKGKAGRPKLDKPVVPYAHLLIRELCGGNSRVRCLRPGCRVRLRHDQDLACCPAHNEYVITLLHRLLQVSMGRKHLRIAHVKEVYIGSTGAPTTTYSNTEFAKRLARGRGRPPGSGGKASRKDGSS